MAMNQHYFSNEPACGSRPAQCAFSIAGREFAFQTDAGVFSRGELAEIVALARPRRSLSERDYVNYVAVCGVDQAGRPLRSTVYDPASLYDASSDRFVGWRKMEVAALRHYTTEAEVNRLAQEMLAERSRRPEYLSLLTPLEPGMRIGQVLEVCGGEQVGAGGQLYRIVGLRHRLERRPRRLALTWVKAKWMGEVSEE